MSRINPIIFQLIFSASLTLFVVLTCLYKLAVTGEMQWIDKVLPLIAIWLPSPAGVMRNWLQEKQVEIVNKDVDKVNIENQ